MASLVGSLKDRPPVGNGVPGGGAACTLPTNALRSSLDRRTEPALVCRLDRRITWVNVAFAEALGRSPEELRGTDWALLVSDDERRAFKKSFRRLGRGEILSDLEVKLERPPSLPLSLRFDLVPDLARETCLALGRDASMPRPVESRPPTLEDQLQDALEQAVEGFALFDHEDRLLHCNEKFRELYPSLVQRTAERPTFEELTREVAYSGRMLAARGREEAWIKDRVRQHKNPGKPRHYKLSDGRWMQIDERRTTTGGIMLVRSDVTLVKQQEQAYALFAAAVDQAAEAIEISDADNKFLYVNPAFTRVTGYSPAEVLGRASSDLLHGDPDGECCAHEMQTAIARGEAWSGRLVTRRRDGTAIHQDATVSPLRGEGGAITHYVAVKRDVTGHVEAEARIRHLAHHDALTDLPNRSLFYDRLHQALAETRRSDEQRALLLLDLDHFKDINDCFGHGAGDAFLCQVAERLQACVRGADTVSRLGGDEFAVLQARAEGATGAAALARRIIDSLARPFWVDGHEITSGVSIGITLIPDDGPDHEQLMKQADLALYRAKAAGRGTFQFFLSDFSDAEAHRAALEHDLREALRGGELALDFQPLFDLENMALRGLEALLRWRHPTRGSIPPVTVIPIAEESGLLVPMTQWVIETACREARTLALQGLPDVKIAVNLSPVQFRHHALVDIVERALAKTGLDGRLLELEVQEPALSHDPKKTLEVMDRLHRLGIRIAMDNFGTGASSLSALRRFPVHRVKIDRTFVHELHTDPGTAAMVKAIIGLGKSLELGITAEGVETEAQLMSLKGEGCEEVQGFLLGRPIPAAKLADAIRATFLQPARAKHRLYRGLEAGD